VRGHKNPYSTKKNPKTKHFTLFNNEMADRGLFMYRKHDKKIDLISIEELEEKVGEGSAGQKGLKLTHSQALVRTRQSEI
jgi:hypothetical protein